jgi:hypothetical protein
MATEWATWWGDLDWGNEIDDSAVELRHTEERFEGIAGGREVTSIPSDSKPLA